MASNYNIVKYFLNDANRTQKALLSHVVAPDFVFTAPLMHPRDFKSYVSFTGSYSSNRKVVIDEIFTENDIDFEVKYTIAFKNSRTSTAQKQSGTLNIKFRNGLIQSLNFNNHFTVNLTQGSVA